MLRALKYIVCVFVALMAFSAISVGDVGNFNDYDSGGSDWSSSSSDSWGSSSSSGWSSSSSSDSWGSSSYSSRGSSFSSTDEPLNYDAFNNFAELAVLFVFAVIILVFIMKGIGKGVQPIVARRPEIPDNSVDITNALQETDPAFNATAFLEWAKEIFFKLQEAWTDREWERVRFFESEELYAQHEHQLQEYKRLGRINVLERINISNAYFFSLTKDREWETLSVVMHVRMIDYIIDERSRQVLKGSPDKDCFMSYFYVFKRKAGVKTISAKQGVDTIACPNCGAPTHVVSSGKCE